MARRSRKQLELLLAKADTRRQQADAHFRLAVFHDNNARPTVAIYHYRRALRLGLPANRKSEALARLASSLKKTNCFDQAIKALHRSLRLRPSPALKCFLAALEHRIVNLLACRKAINNTRSAINQPPK
jgi:tetratricopeptide (TPR) repeat protein